MSHTGPGVATQAPKALENRTTYPMLVGSDKAHAGVIDLPKGSNGFWPQFFDIEGDGKNKANGVEIFLYPRLWTAANDPTDPGLEYGTDWRLIVELDHSPSNAEHPSWFTEGEGEDPDTYQLHKPISGSDALSFFDAMPSAVESDNSGCWFPKPGILCTESCAGKKWLGLQLQVRSGALGGDAEAISDLRAAVEVRAVRSVRF